MGASETAGDAGMIDAVAAHRAYLTALARRRLAPGAAGEEGASDIAQEAAIAAIDAARTGLAPGSDDARLRAWLRRILVNKISQAVRRHRARRRGGGAVQPMPQAEPPGSGTSPSGVVIREEERARLNEAFARLDPAHARLLAWFYTDNLAVKEIADRLGCSPSYASRARKDALRALRRDYEAHAG